MQSQVVSFITGNVTPISGSDICYCAVWAIFGSVFCVTVYYELFLVVSFIGERAKRARHYQGCTNSSWCGIYIYIYVWRYVCHNSSACHAYVMWAELVNCHFYFVPAVLNVVTTGNGTGTKNVLKWNRVLGFEFSIQSSVYGATTLAKVSLFSTLTRCPVSFYSI